MFQNKYITCGVQAEIPPSLQVFMWNCINTLPELKDYLQIFRLSSYHGMQHIIHEQEQPVFQREYLLHFPNPITAKVYVIDNADHCTMLLAEEY